MQSYFIKKHLRTFVAIVLGFVIATFSYFLIVLDNTSPRDNGFVDDKENYIASNMRRCYHAQSKKNCLHTMAKNLVNHFSIKEILVVFAKHEHEKEFFTTCHEIAHYIGQEAYKRVGSIGTIYEQSDETCLGGIFHGAIEGYFMKKNIVLQEANMPKIAKEISHICDEIQHYGNPQYFTQCHHGLGHALMFITADDLSATLALCDNLETTAHRALCYTGAFMQNVINYGSRDHPNAMIKEDDPLYPCTVLDERYQSICYTYAVLERYQGNISKGIALCGMIPPSLRNDCFITFGRNITMYSDNPEVLKDKCAHIKDKEYQTACMVGVASNLVVRYGTQSTLSLEFCSTVDEESKNECYATIGGIAKSILTNPNGIAEFCEDISEAPYRALCMSDDSNL